MPSRDNTSTNNKLLQLESRSWTDDIPVCKESGVGLSTNQVYREDGFRQEEHFFEDRSFHFKYDDETYMYGVFDGHDGECGAKFAIDIVVAELLLGQLTGKTTDEEIKQLLRRALPPPQLNRLLLLPPNATDNNHFPKKKESLGIKYINAGTAEKFKIDDLNIPVV